MWGTKLGWKCAMREYKIQSIHNLHLLGGLGPISSTVQHRQHSYFLAYWDYYFSIEHICSMSNEDHHQLNVSTKKWKEGKEGGRDTGRQGWRKGDKEMSKMVVSCGKELFTFPTRRLCLHEARMGNLSLVFTFISPSQLF